MQKGRFMWGAGWFNQRKTGSSHFSDLVDSSLRVPVSGTLSVASRSSDLKTKKASHEGAFLHLIQRFYKGRKKDGSRDRKKSPKKPHMLARSCTDFPSPLYLGTFLHSSTHVELKNLEILPTVIEECRGVGGGGLGERCPPPSRDKKIQRGLFLIRNLIHSDFKMIQSWPFPEISKNFEKITVY